MDSLFVHEPLVFLMLIFYCTKRTCFLQGAKCGIISHYVSKAKARPRTCSQDTDLYHYGADGVHIGIYFDFSYAWLSAESQDTDG